MTSTWEAPPPWFTSTPAVLLPSSVRSLLFWLTSSRNHGHWRRFRGSKKNANAPVQLGIAQEHSATQQTDLVATPQATPEQAPFLPPAFRWTLRTLCALVLSITGRLVSRATLRKLLHQTGYSFKRRARILLGKADPKQRSEFVLELARLVKESHQEEGPLLVFSDEAHIHLEADVGSGWSRKGVPLYVNSYSPQRGRKLSCFGFYALGSDRPVLLHTASWATAETTNEALRKLREQHPERRIIVIWDNVRYHHSRLVRAEAAQLGIELRFLPPYSPDLMPVERLWSWLRQELTYLHCHPSEQQLAERIAAFVAQLLDEPATVHKRLRPKLSLNPQEEFLRV